MLAVQIQIHLSIIFPEQQPRALQSDRCTRRRQSPVASSQTRYGCWHPICSSVNHPPWNPSGTGWGSLMRATTSIHCASIRYPELSNRTVPTPAVLVELALVKHVRQQPPVILGPPSRAWDKAKLLRIPSSRYLEQPDRVVPVRRCEDHL